jgi:hypothetical protein
MRPARHRGCSSVGLLRSGQTRTRTILRAAERLERKDHGESRHVSRPGEKVLQSTDANWALQGVIFRGSKIRHRALSLNGSGSVSTLEEHVGWILGLISSFAV